MMSPRSVVQGAEGKFTFKGVSPGSYVLHSIPIPATKQAFVVKLPVEVGDQPIENLGAPALAPVDIKMTVSLESGAEGKLNGIRAVLRPSDEVYASVATNTTDDKGEMTLGGLIPGEYLLTLAALQQPLYVSSVRVGEKLVEGQTLDVTSAAAPIVVKVAAATAELAGGVSDESGQPVSGATVALVPWPKRPHRLRIAKTDQAGVFQVSAMPPGDYVALAFEQVEMGRLEDEEFIKPLVAKGQKVKVDTSGKQSLSLRLLPAAQ
jgi:uncharacterized surface anchored protein